MAAYKKQQVSSRISRSLASVVEALEKATQDSPQWLTLTLRQPPDPTDERLVCVGEVDGTVMWLHRDDVAKWQAEQGDDQ